MTGKRKEMKQATKKIGGLDKGKGQSRTRTKKLEISAC